LHSTLPLVGAYIIIIKAASELERPKPQLQLQLPWLRPAFWPARDAFGKLQQTEISEQQPQAKAKVVMPQNGLNVPPLPTLRIRNVRAYI